MKKRRRRRRRIACAVILLVMAAVCAVLSLTVFFKIEMVTVTGNSRYTVEEILEASGIRTGENLFLTNVERASEQIEQAKPYVRTAHVKRKFPAAIEITVEESASAVLGVATGDGYILLDRDLKVLEKGSGALPEGIAQVCLGGVSAAEEGSAIQAENGDSINALKLLLDAADQAGLTSLTYYDVTDPGNMVLTYSGRLDAVLGDRQNMEKKMAMLAEVIRRNDAADPHKSGTIDLRVNGKAYLSGKRTVGA